MSTQWPVIIPMIIKEWKNDPWPMDSLSRIDYLFVLINMKFYQFLINMYMDNRSGDDCPYSKFWHFNIKCVIQWEHSSFSAIIFLLSWNCNI